MTFMTKELSKKVMTGYRLRNNYLKVEPRKIEHFIQNKETNLCLFEEMLSNKEILQKPRSEKNCR